MQQQPPHDLPFNTVTSVSDCISHESLLRHGDGGTQLSFMSQFRGWAEPRTVTEKAVRLGRTCMKVSYLKLLSTANHFLSPDQRSLTGILLERPLGRRAFKRADKDR
eukprot:g44690.t1